MKRLYFETAQQAKRSLNRLANAVLSGEIDQKTANVITYIAQTILQSIRVDEQQRQIDEQKQRLEQLEQDIKELEENEH